jgi:spore coat polysaccharide biosynthesis protein SpsF
MTVKRGRTVAIIQARMSSSRLPGKVMATIADRPMLAHVVSRAFKANLDQVVVATSENVANKAIIDFCRQTGVAFFEGDEDDVLDRFYGAARQFSADVIVRLTADCPLLDPDVINEVVGTFHAGSYDYVSNTLKPTFPDGLDTEVFSFAVLEQAWHEAKLKSEREHVTPFLYKHPERFRVLNVENGEDLSTQRWTVDEPADLELMRAIYGCFKTPDFRMVDVVALLRQYPTLQAMNMGIERNEGYQRSVREDGLIEDNPQ